MTEVYNGYEEKFLTGAAIKQMYVDAFLCDGRHHATVLDVTIPEYIDSTSIKDDEEYRIFCNQYFCRVMNKKTDRLKTFFAHKTLENTIHCNRSKEREPMKCPLCGNRMGIRTGKYGLFWSCTQYPTCKGSSKVKRLGEISYNGFHPYNCD
ncbi:MAG: topoisomerase DNA-binding C4 zinc finger domain-containing protein [Clostridia bacterium]|nr:topoisomerase DNA-binding C4 zinc finger domain-containing protein [Clostridia bacterium]